MCFQGFDGGDEEDRTPDLLNAIQTRSQLRHAPMFGYLFVFACIFNRCDLLWPTTMVRCG